MASPIYRFSEFRLDPARRQLWRGDEELSLPPKAFGCLLYLVENRDRAVTRDELIEAVWNKQNLADSVLGEAIGDVRRALGENGEEQEYIQTVRGFGYRWAAAVEQVEAHSKLDTARKRRMARLWLLLGALVVVGLAASAIHLWQRTRLDPADVATAPLREGNIALVLPVTVEEEDRHPWIRLGVMDLIASRLRAAGQPVVPSDTTIALLRDYAVEPSADEIDELTAAIGTHLVFGARAQASGRHWRISLHTLRGPQPPYTALGEAENVLDAARIAADRMALSLGLVPAPDPDSEPGLATLLQQTEAAMLAQRMDTARELIEAADAETRRHPEVRLQLARIHLYSYELDAAQAALESLLEEPEFERNLVLRARALHYLGSVYTRRGEYEATQPILEEATRVLRRHGKSETAAVLGRIQVDLGTVVAINDGMEAARELLAGARVALESIADIRSLALLDNNVGALEALRERYVESLLYFESSAELYATVHDVVGELWARSNMIETMLGLLDPQAAVRMEPRLNELLARATAPHVTAIGNLNRALLLASNGQREDAESLLAEVTDFLEANDDRSGLRTRALVLRAEHLARNGDITQAARVAARIADPAASQGSIMLDDFLGRSWLILLRARLTEREFGLAEQVAAAMSDLAKYSDTYSPGIYAALAEAELAAAEHRDNAAETAFSRALTMAESGHVPLRLLQVAESYVPWLLIGGQHRVPDPERALRVVDRLAPYVERDYRAAMLQLRVYHAVGSPSAWRAAIDRAQSLAGERQIPPELLVPPEPR